MEALPTQSAANRGSVIEHAAASVARPKEPLAPSDPPLFGDDCRSSVLYGSMRSTQIRLDLAFGTDRGYAAIPPIPLQASIVLADRFLLGARVG